MQSNGKTDAPTDGAGNPDGNEGIFARNLNQGGGAGEDIALKYMHYPSQSLDDALPRSYFKTTREQKRVTRLIGQDMRGRGSVNRGTLLINDLRGGLGNGGYARNQALMVDTGQRGIIERTRAKVMRGFTPDQDPKQKSVG